MQNKRSTVFFFSSWVNVRYSLLLLQPLLSFHLTHQLFFKPSQFTIQLLSLQLLLLSNNIPFILTLCSIHLFIPPTILHHSPLSSSHSSFNYSPYPISIPLWFSRHFALRRRIFHFTNSNRTETNTSAKWKMSRKTFFNISFTLFTQKYSHPPS